MTSKLGPIGLVLSVAILCSQSPTGAQPTKAVEPYVEFDFSTLPSDGDRNQPWRYTLVVYTADKDITYRCESKGMGLVFVPDVVSASTAIHMRESRFKAEVVEKTKLRVYGRNFNDKLIPATRGEVTSPDMPKNFLPKVTNPGKAA